MPEGDISIDVGSAIPYLSEKILSFFGKDKISLGLKNNLKHRISISLEQASYIQCIGMPRPVPMSDLYQPISVLIDRYNRDGRYSIEHILEKNTNSIVLGGPGTGKTILLNWMLLKLVKNKYKTPFLFTLRTPNSVEDLEEFIEHIKKNKTVIGKGHIVLLVDGYDELVTEARKYVSKLLNDFSALRVGNFILTCRLYYTIIDLHANHYFIEPFNEIQAISFTKAFFKSYGFSYNAEMLIEELKEKGFYDFISHPLMLALVCILKTGPTQTLPKNTIGLIRRAIDTLTFRWDESRGVARDSTIPLDGEERVRCLMRIAYRFPQPLGSESIALSEAQIHLHLCQRSDVSPLKLIEEIAQWYGLFVPVTDNQWSFTHRTIHDFLAARFLVESGQLNSHSLSASQFNSRTAYAACLIPDATEYLTKALYKTKEKHVLIECLSNNAMFDTKKIAKEFVKYYKRNNNSLKYYCDPKNLTMSVSISVDLFHHGNNEFLNDLVEAGTYTMNQENNVVYLLAIHELKTRGIKLSTHKVRADLKPYTLIVEIGNNEIEPFKISDL